MRIKTVVIINDFNFVNGGAAKVALDTAALLEKAGKQVYFFSAVNDEKNRPNLPISYITTNQQASLEDSNKIRGAFNGIYNHKAAKQLEKLLDTLDNKTTIVHVHGWMKALSSSIFRILDKKHFQFVVTFHDYFSLCPNGGFYQYPQNKICDLKPLSLKCIKCNCDSRNYMIKLYRVIRQWVQNKIIRINERIRYVIAISNFSYEILKQGIRKDAIIRKITNPIDTLEEKIEPEKNSIYLYVGRISKEKGVSIFCKAVSELELSAVIIGDGPERIVLEKQYPNITFAGWKNKQEVQEYMKKARALIFPSIWYEGAPLTILEAQAIGLPVIVSKSCAGIEYSLTDLQFDPDDIETLKEKIEQCQENEFLSEKSLLVYQQYQKDYQKEYAQELMKFYEEIGEINEN